MKLKHVTNMVESPCLLAFHRTKGIRRKPHHDELCFDSFLCSVKGSVLWVAVFVFIV